MKLLSDLSGELIRKETLLPCLNDQLNLARYRVTNTNGHYEILNVFGETCSAWFVDIGTKHRGDIITAFTEQPATYLLISLSNYFTVKLTGTPPLLLYDLSYVLVSAPALIVENRLQQASNYSLLIVLFPHAGINSVSTILPLTKSMVQIAQQLNSQVNSKVSEQCQQLLTMATKEYKADHKANVISIEDAKRLQTIRAYIEKNIFEGVKIGQIAKGTDINETYIKTIFKNYLRTTAHNYIMERRLQIAMRLICEPENKIEQVAHMMGINKATLYRQFKKVYQCSPAEYRRLQNG